MRRFVHDGKLYIYLDTKEQAEEFVPDKTVEEVLGWFEDERGVPTEEFLDQLVKDYGTPPFNDNHKLGFDLDSYDNEATRNILSRARKIKKEQE